MISPKEYRKILNDYKSSEEQIKKRLEYLEAFCRNIIKQELESVRRIETNDIAILAAKELLWGNNNICNDEQGKEIYG